MTPHVCDASCDASVTPMYISYHILNTRYNISSYTSKTIVCHLIISTFVLPYLENVLGWVLKELEWNGL